MGRKPIFIFICLVLGYDFTNAIKKHKMKSNKGYQVQRILVKNLADADELRSLKEEEMFDFWNDIEVGSHVDIMTSPKNADVLENWIKQRGMEASVSMKDVESLVNKNKGSDNEKFRKHVASKYEEEEEIMDWTSYHSLEAIYKWFDYLEATFDFCKKESIGKSYEGQDMIIMKVCRGGCGNKPAIWIDSGIHAREWVTIATGTWMLNELVENDANHTELTKKLDWYFLPSHNPDGYRISRDSGNQANFLNRFWRKSTTHNGHCYDSECRGTGTDLNRNWGFHWDEGGASNFSGSPIYHGPKPFSEVEVRNVRDFLLAHKEKIKLYQSLHAYSQIILMPWSYTKEMAPGYKAMENLAIRGAKAMYATHGERYEVGCVPCLLYPASGISLDWVLGVAGIPYAFCIELRDKGQWGFLLPEDQIIPTAEETWAWHVVAAEQIIEEFAYPTGKTYKGKCLSSNGQNIGQKPLKNGTSSECKRQCRAVPEATACQFQKDGGCSYYTIVIAKGSGDRYTRCRTYKDGNGEFSFWGAILSSLYNLGVQAFNSTGMN